MKKLFFLCLFFSAPLHADSVGPIFPSTCSNSAFAGNTNWVNPSSGTVEDGNNASNTGATSNYLYCSGYNFNVPSNVIITGISAGAKQVSLINSNVDNSIRLFESGVAVGSDKSVGALIPGDPTWADFGGATDTWGLSLTPTIVNDVLFGAGFSETKSAGGPTSYGIDAERMTIFYAKAPLTTSISSGKINSGKLQ